MYQFPFVPDGVPVAGNFVGWDPVTKRPKWMNVTAPPSSESNAAQPLNYNLKDYPRNYPILPNSGSEVNVDPTSVQELQPLPPTPQFPRIYPVLPNSGNDSPRSVIVETAQPIPPTPQYPRVYPVLPNSENYFSGRTVNSWCWSALDTNNTTATRFLNQAGSNVTAASNEDGSINIQGWTGILTALYFRFGTALAAANTTITVRINGVDTALTLTVNSGTQTGSITGLAIAVAAGDRVTVSITTSAADATSSRPRATVVGIPS